MESQALLGQARDAQLWGRVRCRLLLLFWIAMAAMLAVALVLILRAYKPASRAPWHQRRVLCSISNRPITNQTDLGQMMGTLSLLGCGGVITRLPDEGLSALNLVTEGQRYGLRVVLDIVVLEDRNGSRLQEEACHWIRGGVSGFHLSGRSRDSVMMVSDLLSEELEGAEDRIILLPDWLCEENVSNKSRLLRTCLLSEWKPLEVMEGRDHTRTAWKAPPSDLLQFMAAALPGTVILTLSQTQLLPFWLRPLLLLRFQSPALYAGWLQPLPDNSTYGVLCHWGCSALLVTINPSNETASFPLHLPHYTAAARLLLSSQRRRNQGQTMRGGVSLEPGEAQLLRLMPDEL